MCRDGIILNRSSTFHINCTDNDGDLENEKLHSSLGQINTMVKCNQPRKSERFLQKSISPIIYDSQQYKEIKQMNLPLHNKFLTSVDNSEFRLNLDMFTIRTI